MSKVKHHQIDRKEKYRIVGNFYEIVAGLKSKKEVIDFFVGIFTPSEAIMMARRIQVAKMILDGKSYNEIRKQLKVSFQTITKTDHWLNNRGDEYRQWIEKRLKKIETKNTGAYSEGMLNKYAHHRLLKDLFR